MVEGDIEFSSRHIKFEVCKRYPNDYSQEAEFEVQGEIW